jgi:hypothetical protein
MTSGRLKASLISCQFKMQRLLDFDFFHVDLLQKSCFVIPEVVIGNPFFKKKDLWIPAFAGMTANTGSSGLLQDLKLIKMP